MTTFKVTKQVEKEVVRKEIVDEETCINVPDNNVKLYASYNGYPEDVGGTYVHALILAPQQNSEYKGKPYVDDYYEFLVDAGEQFMKDLKEKTSPKFWEGVVKYMKGKC